MPLVDTEIKRALASGAWKAYRDGQPVGIADLKISPNSVDCTLGDEILRVKPHWLHGAGAIDPAIEGTFYCHPIPLAAGKFLIEPGNLYLASVRESFDCSAPLDAEHLFWRHCKSDGDFLESSLRYEKVWFAPMIDGRSTLARVGLSVHNTAGFGDFGFDGQFTLEISCILPIVLYPGMRIAQVSFHELTGSPTQRYSGAYTGQTGPRPAVLGEGRI